MLPDGLNLRPLPITPIEQPLYRLHDAPFQSLFFGRLRRYRFDAPEQQFGVLYAAEDAHAAFVETFGRLPAGRVITRTALARSDLARITFLPPLRLVDLTGPGLARLGADARLCTDDYTVAQHWSLALWQHPDLPDGIRYRSRHDPSRWCVAVYDRHAFQIDIAAMGNLLSPPNRALLAQILDTYEFGLI